jgi:ribonuclease VapC
VSSVVLDASAVLAVLFAEKGAETVIPQLPGALLSCINLAEVTSRALDCGKSLEDTISEIARLPLRLVEFDAGQAHITASLRPTTKVLGLSLGDRACLALGIARQAKVLTGDRDWAKLRLDVEIVLFR